MNLCLASLPFLFSIRCPANRRCLVFVSSLDQSNISISLFQKKKEHSTHTQKIVGSFGSQSVKVFNQDDSKLSFSLAGSKEHDMLRHLRNPETRDKPILTNWLNGICRKIITSQRHYKLYKRC